MTIRKIIFWLHVAAGVVCGLVIAIMSFTGAALAFKRDIVAWTERDARLVTPPAEPAVRLPLEDLSRWLGDGFSGKQHRGPQSPKRQRFRPE